MGQGLLDDVFAGSDGIAAILLDLFGGTSSITHEVDGAYDPETGVETGASTVVDADVDISPPTPYRAQDIDGESVRQEDRWSLVPEYQVSIPLIPNKVTVVVNSIRYRMIAYEPILSGDETAAYKLQLRV